jgi:glycoside hydrolase-like protein
MRAFWLVRGSAVLAAAALGLAAAGAGGGPVGAAARTVTAFRAGTASGAARAATASGQATAARAATAGGAGTASRLKRVQYQGYTFEVPASWPVVDEALHPRGCVRFDEHVVYLGAPGANQSCPSWLFGTTEAVLIQSAGARQRRTSVENPISRVITVTAPRVRVTATFDTNPGVIYSLVASARLPAPDIELPNPAILDAAQGHPVPAPRLASALSADASQLAGRRPGSAQKAVPVRLPALPAGVANFRGLGFDACAAPSMSYMRRWKSRSPYGAVGIYIGGSDRACDQANLTAAWVHREASAGWRFFPMYAGPQAAFGELKSPASQGARAAADAVVQAQRLGFGPRTPIYYDMEAYPARDTGAALRFLSAWTKGLHRLGYLSGVYSSSRSGIIDLARNYSGHTYAMPDTIYDALWNDSRNVQDTVYGQHSWPLNRRLHQFSGNDTQDYGGATIDVDQDYLDVDLPTPGGTMAGTQAVEASSVFYEGRGHHLWRRPRQSGDKWGKAVDMGGDLSSPPSVVSVGRAGLAVFYRGRSGQLWIVRRTASGWQRGRQIGLMGVLGSAPRAVAQPNGVIDVFWKGSADDHLWHGQYSPGRGWSGPQRLGGALAGAPAPVESRRGVLQVFWEGRGSSRSLDHVVRHLGRAWGRPASLGMGPLGGAPHAAALPDGAIVVVWRGSTSPHHVWSAYLRPGAAARGPRNLGGVIRGTPWPAAAQWTARVFYRGGDGRLHDLRYKSAGWWSGPARIPVGKLGSAPFAAAGMGTGPFEVFWTGVHGGLWAASGSGRRWSGPQRVGGWPR